MELSNMLNIGKEMQRKLNSIGITNAEELKSLGSKGAFFRLKASYPEVCLVHLYALQGAIEGPDHNRLSKETKADLKAFSDSLK